MPQGDIKNQRKFPRIDIDLPVLVIGKGGRCTAHLRNVSLGGCLLEGPIQARVGEILVVTCRLTESQGEFRARIQWAVPKQDNSNFGGSFWGADEPTKRVLIQRIIEMAKPENPRAAQLLMG